MPEMPGDGLASSPSAPASSGWSRRRPSCFPTRASWCCRAISSTSVERLREELDDVAQGRFDIVIGTQLVAKGHHFPKLNLVGIVDADLGLGNGDPRAAERTFQLLHQVVGRAGREEGRGVGYLQTHQPEHPVMRALIARRPRGVLHEPRSRCASRPHYPPFGRLASLLISGRRQARRRSLCAPARRRRAARTTRCACSARPKRRSRVVRGRHRFRLLVKSPRAFDLSAYLRDWLAAAPKPRATLKLEVDVDPQSFL